MAKASRSTIMAEYKHLGREPEFKDSDHHLTEVELIRVYSWYNALRDNDDAKTFIADYCKLHNIKFSISKHTTNTYAWLARAIMRGAQVSDYHKQRLHTYLATLKPERAVDKPKEPVAVRTINKLDLWVPAIEEAIDKYQEGFDPYQFYTSQSIPQSYVKQIVEIYKPQLMEVHEAYQKVSEDLVQGYKNFSRTELKKFGLFLKAIVDDGERYVGNVKKERRPRKKKAKSTTALLKYFKCQPNSVELKISSEDPAKIIGANAVYVLNTKNNILTMFLAADDKGLTVSRTSIANYDEKQTVSKRVGRKVEAVIKQILEGTKKSRLRVLEKVATEATSVSDRISENHIILRVDK